MKEQQSYIDFNGRLAIPAKIRKKLKLNVGDKVSIKYNDSELIVSTFHSNIKKARNIIEKYRFAKNINSYEKRRCIKYRKILNYQ